ncbi:MAG: helix-turn-helix domain-containing protein [Gammaproteobacteria bacterium]|nr:helix-turn-helix domain-containing protein [Gammaproteobacteria bacterium]
MDVLSDILRTLHLRAEVFLHACFRGDWAVDTSGERRATFHMVARGGCWLHMPDGREPVALAGGDLVVFPHDAMHTLSNSEYAPAADFPRNQLPAPDVAGPAVNLICGYFEFERHSWNPLLESLPDVIVIRNEASAAVPLMDTLGRFLYYEVDSEHIGGSLLIDKLSEILFVLVVRSHIKDGNDNGFIGALADAQIGKALSKMHEAPSHAWTVESLAKAAGMSRSVFAERFSRLAGMSPMQYLTRWRMTQANELFLTTEKSVAQVAERCGYQSEVAFAKAFKKQFGYGPGRARREKRLSR